LLLIDDIAPLTNVLPIINDLRTSLTNVWLLISLAEAARGKISIIQSVKKIGWNLKNFLQNSGKSG
jgi:hypothetical protein